MIEFHNVYLKYKKDILKNITFSIKKGQIIGILGPSGSGKTTLGKIVAGYVKPTSGKVKVNSKNVTKPNKSRIMIFQESDLFPWKTVEENIKLFSKNTKLYTKLLRTLKMNNYLSYYPAELSGGMKSRISFIRALATEPEVLILDEVFASIDTELRKQLYSELLKIWSYSKTTIILITHDIEEAIFLSDKVVILENQAPSNIKNIIDIPFKRPRSKDIIFNDDFLKIRKKISSDFDNEY